MNIKMRKMSILALNYTFWTKIGYPSCFGCEFNNHKHLKELSVISILWLQASHQCWRWQHRSRLILLRPVSKGLLRPNKKSSKEPKVWQKSQKLWRLLNPNCLETNLGINFVNLNMNLPDKSGVKFSLSLKNQCVS